MPSYVANATDKSRDYVTPNTASAGAGGQTNVSSQILAGLAAVEQTPHQAQPTLVRVRDFRN